MNNKKIFKLKNIELLLFIIILLFLLNRIRYGVEISDDTFYIAEAFLDFKGSTPIIDIWSQTSLTTILYSWIVKLYFLIFKSTEGIVLFFKYTFILYKIIVLFISFLFLKRYFDKEIVILSLISLFPFSYGILINFSYNSLGISLLFLSEIILTSSILEKNKNTKKWFFLLGGIISSFSVLAYPSLIIICIYNTIVLYILKENKYYKYYILSGIITAIIIILWLAISGGSFYKIYEGILIILKYNPYFKIEHYPLSRTLFFILKILKFLIFKVFILALVISIVFNKLLYKSFIKKSVLNTFFIITIPVSCILLIKYFSEDFYLTILGITINIVISLMLILYRKKIKKELFFFLYLPFNIFYFLATLGAFDGGLTRGYIFISEIVLFFIILGDIVFNLKIKQFYLFFIIFTIVFSMCILQNSYSLNYREAEMSELKYKVKTGIYKGLYTTQNRGESLEKLEKELKKVVFPKDKVLFMETVPMGYLMVFEAIPFAPTTWDIMQYSYGFNNDEIMQLFFAQKKDIPDKIIYIFTGRDKILSIDKKDYKFNNFVNKNYNFLEEKQTGIYYFKIFIKK